MQTSYNLNGSQITVVSTEKDLGVHVSFFIMGRSYRSFSHDVTAAMLVYQNKGMAAILVYKANPLGIELYFYANTFFCFIEPIWPLVT